MTDAQEDHQGTASIGGKTITNLRFADELASLVDSLDKTFGMEIIAEKTKLMTNNANGISIDIRINGKKLHEVDSFKYLGVVVTDQGSKPEVLSRIAQTTAALARLKTIWRDMLITPDGYLLFFCVKQAEELCRIVSLHYSAGPPTLCCLKLGNINYILLLCSTLF